MILPPPIGDTRAYLLHGHLSTMTSWERLCVPETADRLMLAR
jgi:hypothetical protein